MPNQLSDLKRSNDPIFWMLFSAGGMLSALILPVLIVLLGFVLPAGEVSLERVNDVFNNVLIRIVVVIVSSLAFWHAAHRIRFTLVHVGLHGIAMPIAVVSYGAALVGTIWVVAVVIFV